MIERIVIKGFRVLRDFEWVPSKGLNILVGANSAGKSTVLDAIELVTRGSLHGQSARFALSPDWFNKDDVEQFFAALADEDPKDVTAPEICIAVTFADDPRLAGIRGMNGPEGAKVDASGLVLTCAVRQELCPQFIAESKTMLGEGADWAVLPVEYYECKWASFKGDSLIRKPKGVSCSRVDADPEPYSRAVDSYARNIINGELKEEELRRVTSAFRSVALTVDKSVLAPITIQAGSRPTLGLQVDKSPKSDWKNSVVLHREGLPLAVLGSAEQILTKCSVALANAETSSVLLLEEPECHLSHTSLNVLVDLVGAAVDDGRQVFVTTHSPFVLNRLGLDRMAVMAEGMSPTTIGGLSKGTVRYFKRLSGYDTLRVALAEKVVLVEGPTDEMAFAWAFRKTRGCLPQDCGIDVIECGTQHRRLLEFAAALGRGDVVALRDNDGKPESHWVDLAKPYISEGRKYICGHDDEGRTIEPQMTFANRGKLAELAKAVDYGEDLSELEQFMTDHKTEWALSLLEKDPEATGGLEAPRYIREAIDFIYPKPDGGHE